MAAYQAGVIRQAGSLGPEVPITLIRAWANDANIEAEKMIRQVREDYFLRTMNATSDTTAQKIRGISYVPSTSLKILTTSQKVTLPPDFLTLKSIRVITTGYEGTRLEHLDMSHPEFKSVLSSTLANGESGMFYDILADRTMWCVPSTSVELALELSYIARTAQLQYYATGTLAVTDATVAVTGTTTAWALGTVFDANYLDLITGSTGNAAIPTPDPSTPYDSITRHRVASITDDTHLVLSYAKSGTLAAGTGYFLTSIPQLPEEAHFALVDFITSKILATVGSVSRADWFMARFKDRIGGIVTSAARRQVADIEVTEDWEG